jgi:hypothetical protein
MFFATIAVRINEGIANDVIPADAADDKLRDGFWIPVPPGPPLDPPVRGDLEVSMPGDPGYEGIGDLGGVGIGPGNVPAGPGGGFGVPDNPGADWFWNRYSSNPDWYQPLAKAAANPLQEFQTPHWDDTLWHVYGVQSQGGPILRTWGLGHHVGIPFENWHLTYDWQGGELVPLVHFDRNDPGSGVVGFIAHTIEVFMHYVDGLVP